MKRIIHPKQKEQGQSMIELAMTFVILMVLLAGTVDLGHAFFIWLGMRDAAQEGASYGSFDPLSTAKIEARVRANLVDVIKDPAALIYVNVDPSSPACLGDTPATITVDVDYDNFPITMPFLGAIIGDFISIHAEVTDSIILPVCH